MGNPIETKKKQQLLLVMVFLKDPHVEETYHISQAEKVDGTNLELGVALVQKHIHDRQLADVAVLLELLADLGADGGYGHAQGVHGLDLRGLYLVVSR